jgi:hypothetical protein
VNSIAGAVVLLAGAVLFGAGAVADATLTAANRWGSSIGPSLGMFAGAAVGALGLAVFCLGLREGPDGQRQGPALGSRLDPDAEGLRGAAPAARRGPGD